MLGVSPLQNWMAQLGFASKAKPPAEDKGTADEPPAAAAVAAKVEPQQHAAPATASQQRAAEDSALQAAQPERGPSAAAAALAAAKAAASATAHSQASVTETRRFAGKDIQVGKAVSMPCFMPSSACVLAGAWLCGQPRAWDAARVGGLHAE